MAGEIGKFGKRVPWAALPESLRALINQHLNAPISPWDFLLVWRLGSDYLTASGSLSKQYTHQAILTLPTSIAGKL